MDDRGRRRRNSGRPLEPPEQGRSRRATVPVRIRPLCDTWRVGRHLGGRTCPALAWGPRPSSGGARRSARLFFVTQTPPRPGIGVCLRVAERRIRPCGQFAAVAACRTRVPRGGQAPLGWDGPSRFTMPEHIGPWRWGEFNAGSSQVAVLIGKVADVCRQCGRVAARQFGGCRILDSSRLRHGQVVRQRRIAAAWAGCVRQCTCSSRRTFGAAVNHLCSKMEWRSADRALQACAAAGAFPRPQGGMIGCIDRWQM